MIQNYKKNKSVQIYNGIFLLFHSFLPFIPIPGTFFHVKSTPSPIPISGKFIPDHSPFSDHPPNAQAGNVNPDIEKTVPKQTDTERKRQDQKSAAPLHQECSTLALRVQPPCTESLA